MDYAVARHNMVENQIRTKGVTEGAIIDAFENVPREIFVPAHLATIAYVDHDLMITEHRCILEPLVIAKLLQSATILPDEIVLEIGCGTGYSTAILSNLASTVVGIEEEEQLANQATSNLIELGFDNVAIMTSPLTEGYEKQGPYNVIVISGSVGEVPYGITDQLADGGRLVTIIEKNDSLGKGVLMTKFGSTVGSREVFDASAPTLPGFERGQVFTL